MTATQATAAAAGQERPRLILSHGEKGGVGKTTVARVISDFLTGRGLKHRAYDAEGATGQLLRFHGSVTMPVDVTDAASVSPVLDHLMDDDGHQIALVDLGARTGSDLKSWLYRGGALEEASGGRLGLTVVYVIGNTVDSVGHLKECFQALGKEMNYLLAKNLGVSQKFEVYENSNVRADLMKAGAREITIPALDPAVFQAVDRASVSFTSFADNQGGKFSYTHRRYCRTWLRECYTALEPVAHLLR